METPDTPVQRGSSNVFADLAVAKAERNIGLAVIGAVLPAGDDLD